MRLTGLSKACWARSNNVAHKSGFAGSGYDDAARHFEKGVLVRVYHFDEMTGLSVFYSFLNNPFLFIHKRAGEALNPKPSTSPARLAGAPLLSNSHDWRRK